MGSSLASDVSICITTYSRQAILQWHLQVLDRLGFGGQVVISEGGPKPFRVPASLNLGFEVKSLHLPREEAETAPENAARCMNAALTEATRPYFTMTCDDDLRVPLALREAQSMLHRDASISAVLATRIYLKLEPVQRSENRSEFRVRLPRTHRFSLPYAKVSESKSLSDPDLVSRLGEFEQNRFHGMFAVMRTGDRPPESGGYRFQNPHCASDYQWLFNPVFRGKTVSSNTVGTISLIHGKNLSFAENNPFRSDPATVEDLRNFARLWDSCSVENIELVCDILNRFDSTSRRSGLLEEMVTSAKYFYVSRKWCSTLNRRESQ